MPIHISWYDEAKTIMIHRYEEPWTIADYYAHIRRNYDLIEEVGHRVDIINDLRDLVQIPPDIIGAIRHAAHSAHENEGINMIVAANTLIQILVEKVYSSANVDVTPIRFVDTIEQALAVIAADRQKES